MAVYTSSKAAQTHMILNFARHLAPDGITLNNLAPGVIRSDRNVEALADETYAEKVRGGIPAGLFGQPSGCAGAVNDVLREFCLLEQALPGHILPLRECWIGWVAEGQSIHEITEKGGCF